jgi:hypothetical protein
MVQWQVRRVRRRQHTGWSGSAVAVLRLLIWIGCAPAADCAASATASCVPVRMRSLLTLMHVRPARLGCLSLSDSNCAAMWSSTLASQRPGLQTKLVVYANQLSCTAR